MSVNAETLLATVLSTRGLKKKRSAQRRPRSEVEKVLAEVLISGQQAANPEGVLLTIEQIMAQGGLSK